jgi:hypothetical protein
VNNRDLSGSEGNARLDHNAPSVQFRFDLHRTVLNPDGKNTIEILAFDSQNFVSSRPVTVAWDTTPIHRRESSQFFAVVAGISDYANPQPRLKYAAKDAEDFAQHCCWVRGGCSEPTTSRHFSSPAMPGKAP